MLTRCHFLRLQLFCSLPLNLHVPSNIHNNFTTSFHVVCWSLHSYLTFLPVQFWEVFLYSRIGFILAFTGVLTFFFLINAGLYSLWVKFLHSSYLRGFPRWDFSSAVCSFSQLAREYIKITLCRCIFRSKTEIISSHSAWCVLLL